MEATYLLLMSHVERQGLVVAMLKDGADTGGNEVRSLEGVIVKSVVTFEDEFKIELLFSLPLFRPHFLWLFVNI